MKSRYRYTFRTLTNPPQRLTLEAGPFDAFEAGTFGETEASKQAWLTGREWVYDYQRIVEAQPEEVPRLSIFERIAMWWSK
jgi:hypothetical protein